MGNCQLYFQSINQSAGYTCRCRSILRIHRREIDSPGKIRSTLDFLATTLSTDELSRHSPSSRCRLWRSKESRISGDVDRQSGIRAHCFSAEPMSGPFWESCSLRLGRTRIGRCDIGLTVWRIKKCATIYIRESVECVGLIGCIRLTGLVLLVCPQFWQFWHHSCFRVVYGRRAHHTHMHAKIYDWRA